MHSGEVVRMRGEVIEVEEILDGSSDGAGSNEEGIIWTAEREEAVTNFEVEVDGIKHVSEEEKVVEGERIEDQESEEEDDEDLEISGGEARLRGVVKVVEDIPIEEIEIIDGGFARIKVDVRFDVRFKLDRHSTAKAPDWHGQADN